VVLWVTTPGTLIGAYQRSKDLNSLLWKWCHKLQNHSMNLQCRENLNCSSLVSRYKVLRPGFSPSAVHIGFLLDKVSLGQVILRTLGFPLSIIIPQTLHIYLSPGAGRRDTFTVSVPRDCVTSTPRRETTTDVLWISDIAGRCCRRKMQVIPVTGRAQAKQRCTSASLRTECCHRASRLSQRHYLLSVLSPWIEIIVTQMVV
jgi:hypothetical protein